MALSVQMGGTPRLLKKLVEREKIWKAIEIVEKGDIPERRSSPGMFLL